MAQRNESAYTVAVKVIQIFDNERTKTVKVK